MKSVVIIVTWNRLDLIKQLFAALRKQKDKNFSVVVVDNGSNDGTDEFLGEQTKKSKKNNFETWALLLPENAGFALPNNLAMTYATEFLEFDYFILLNNDTIPGSGFIKTLHNKAESYLRGNDQKNLEIDKKLFPFLSKRNLWKIGSFAPLVENYFAKSRVDAAGIKISPDGNAINRGVGEKTYKYNREKEVFGPSGSAALHLKKSLLDVALPPRITAILQSNRKQSIDEEKIWNVGLKNYGRKTQGIILPIREFFASRYFAYFEDVDLAWRLRLRGWGCVYLPKAKILHYHSATAKSYSTFKSFYIHRNQYFNILRDFPSYYVATGILKAFNRYLYLLQSLWNGKGPTAEVARKSGKLKVFAITVEGWGDILKNIFGLFKERTFIQSNRAISLRDFQEIISSKRFLADFHQMIFETPDFLKEHNSSGERDKAPNA